METRRLCQRALYLVVAAALVATPGVAQYMYLDTNGDGIHTSADTLNAPGVPTTLTVYLDTNHDRNGSTQTCNSHTGSPSTPGAALDIFSYALILQVADVGGSVTWGSWADSLGFSPLGSDLSTPTNLRVSRASGVTKPPGLCKLGQVMVTVISGVTFIRIGRFIPSSDALTAFGTSCDASTYGYTYALGIDWFDTDGAGPGEPALPLLIPSVPSLKARFLSFDTGIGAYAVASADFNSDGRPDLAVANYASNTVSVFLGGGDGTYRTFGTKVDYSTGTQPRSVAVADVNGDGKCDLIATNNSQNTVSVLSGNGDGTFAGRTDFSAGAGPQVVAAADFNGDGKQDLAVTNGLGNTVSVLLGNGNGTFGSPVGYSTGLSPIGLTAVDVGGGTGPVDLVVANSGGNTVSVLPGNGDGTFGAQATYATGTRPLAVIVARINGDAYPDLAVANYQDGTVSILLGSAAVTFGAKTDFACGAQPTSITSADFNVDGRRDLAVANSGTISQAISVLIGNGDGTFGSAATFSSGKGPNGILAVDVNSDARHDLVVPNYTASTVAVLLGNGDGTFGSALLADAGQNQGPKNVALGDLNGDGRLDAAVAHYNNFFVGVLLGTGTGAFGPRTDVQFGGLTGSVVIADVNNDGKQDLVATQDSLNVVSVTLGNGDGTFNSRVSYPTGTVPTMVAVKDLNADGLPDLTVVSNSVVSVLLGTGGGVFGPKTDYGIGVGGRWVLAQDVDADGVPDLVVTNYVSGTVGVLKGNGNGTFAGIVTYSAGTHPEGLTAGDVTGDGKPDLLVANDGTAQVSLLVNTGSGFGSASALATGLSPRRVALADMNGDGKLDVVTANASPVNSVSVLLGVGNGTFATRRDFGAGTNPHGLALADLDGNGSADVVTVNDEYAGTITILLNRAVVTAVASTAPGVSALSLGQNYPNPFNPLTSVDYTLSAVGHIGLRIFDVQGRLVATLVDATLPPGPHRAHWDGTDHRGRGVASGVYFYRLEANGSVVTRKMVLAR